MHPKNHEKGVPMMKSISQHDSAREIATVTISPSRWNQVWHFLLMILITFSLITILSFVSGCSGGGGGGTPATDTTDNTDNTDDTDGGDYEGSAKVSGTIKLSYLSSSDSAELESSAPVARRKASKAVEEDSEALKLYVVGEDGELEDTGISCSLEEGDDGDRVYECDGVKDGVNYIIRYLKLSGTGKALELKANAYVPEGSDAPEDDVDVSPQTSVVVEALVAAIMSATAGTDISDDVVNAIIESIKEAIETLVASGVIQIPSMVMDVDEDMTLDEMIGEEPENDDLGNAAGLILADDSIDTELGFIASEKEAELFDLSTIDTADEKKELIRKVFNDLLSDEKGGQDNVPEYIYDFFVWLYVNNDTVTMEELLNTLLDSMHYAPEVDQNRINQVTVDNILAMFNEEIGTMHELLAMDPASLSDEQKKALARIPGVFRGLFPASFGTATRPKNLITPQAIALIIYVEKVFMPATILPQNLTGTVDEGGQMDYSVDEYFWWDDKPLFALFGMDTYVISHLAEFTGVGINGLHIHPGTVWLEGEGQREALMLGTDLMNLSAVIGDNDPAITDESGATVTLTYPKASGGTGTIALVFLSWGEGGYWGLDPWNEAYINDQTNPVINPDRIVSDFTSGTYTITVVLNGETTSKSFQKTVITGMSDSYVKMITPAGMPNWPGMDASQEELEAFNAARNAFDANGGRTNFSANVMDDGSVPGDGETATKAKITVSWEPPVVDLPDGVKMVYSLDIGQSQCDEFNNCTWNQVWNSWENNKRIYTTAFTIPHLFEVQGSDEAQTNPYHINIGVYFVDQATGEQLGSGGNAHSEFTVGEPIDLSATFTIRGLNAIVVEDPNVAPAELRAAVVKETMDGAMFTRTIVGIADITGSTGYGLTFEIGDFLGANSANTWYNVILVVDANDELGKGDALNYATMTFWPDYSSGGMWFETWGGMLKIGKNTFTSGGNNVNNVDVITGGEIIDGPTFYIGANNFIAPEPENVTPVSSDKLDDWFTITGEADVTGLTNPIVVLIEEGYDETSGFIIETVIHASDVSGGQYVIDALVGDFYDLMGQPTDKRYHIVLVDDADSQIVVGSSLPGHLPKYWPDWTKGGFGFDTWRGENLYIHAETYDPETQIWSKYDWAVPEETTDVTGPYLSKM